MFPFCFQFFFFFFRFSFLFPHFFLSFVTFPGEVNSQEKKTIYCQPLVNVRINSDVIFLHDTENCDEKLKLNEN